MCVQRPLDIIIETNDISAVRPEAGPVASAAHLISEMAARSESSTVNLVSGTHSESDKFQREETFKCAPTVRSAPCDKIKLHFS